MSILSFPIRNSFLSTDIKQALIRANRDEYGSLYSLLTFAGDEKIAAANAERKELLLWLEQHATFGYAGTKVNCSGLSTGCLHCGCGGWSCLFINGICNARCFYCPTAQDDDGSPVTNGLTFTSPNDYAAYVSSMGFSGVSISGGEPLLTPELTLSYLKAVRSRCGDDLHLWLYTNGTLLTPDLCKKLRDAGLNEIRFDLGAVGYNLKKLRLAIGCIPEVSVEIPAVPEDEDLLKLKMLEMAEHGVNHLNLHQMRLTPYNFGQMTSRGYTFIHGEKVTVLDSELCALRMVRYGLEHSISLPVNYCSFAYKRRFQHSAARRRAALKLVTSGECVTEPGYLRIRSATGVSYSEAVILQNPSYQLPFEKVMLETGRSLYLERRPVATEINMSDVEFGELTKGLIPERVLRFEQIEAGLSEYF